MVPESFLGIGNFTRYWKRQWTLEASLWKGSRGTETFTLERINLTLETHRHLELETTTTGRTLAVQASQGDTRKR